MLVELQNLINELDNLADQAAARIGNGQDYRAGLYYSGVMFGMEDAKDKLAAIVAAHVKTRSE